MSNQTLAKIDKIVLHHSASRNTTTGATIRNWHLKRGWRDIGYHYVIAHGRPLFYGRPLSMVPAAQRGHNTNSVAICVSGWNGDSLPDGRDPADWNWTDEQIGRASDLVAGLQLVLPLRKIVVRGHRDFAATICPGLDVQDVV